MDEAVSPLSSHLSSAPLLHHQPLSPGVSLPPSVLILFCFLIGESLWLGFLVSQVKAGGCIGEARGHVRPLALLREVCYDFPKIWLKEGGGGGGQWGGVS